MWPRILIRWLITSIAVAAAIVVLRAINPDWVTLNGSSAWIGVLVMAAILGFVNAIIKPILAFLSCGCIIATLGLFMLVINAFTLWLSGVIASWFNTGFSVNGFWPAFWGGIIISIVSFLLSIFLPEPEDEAIPE
jgi:putative membrane protein